MGFLPTARQGDRNTTLGPIISGSRNVKAGGKGVARTGDRSRCNAPATLIPVTFLLIGNPRILVNNRPKARVTTTFLPPCTVPSVPPVPIPTIVMPPGAVRVLI